MTATGSADFVLSLTSSFHTLWLATSVREFSRNNPKEDSITRNLVSRLSASATVREIVVVEYQFEPFRVDARGNCVSTGKVDFVAHSVSIASPPGIPLRETYVAYECKRLNVQEATRMRYLAPRRHDSYGRSRRSLREKTK